MTLSPDTFAIGVMTGFCLVLICFGLANRAERRNDAGALLVFVFAGFAFLVLSILLLVSGVNPGDTEF